MSTKYIAFEYAAYISLMMIDTNQSLRYIRFFKVF